MGEAGFAESPQRRLACVWGRWRVAYLCDAGQETAVRRGLLVGPLVADRTGSTLWVAVVPDGGTQRTMIRRDAITRIAPPR